MSKLRVVADSNLLGLSDQPALDITFLPGRDIGPDALQDADALLVRSITPVGEALLRDSPVRFVGTATSGYDHIDRSFLASAGVEFTHAPGSNANSVVEYVLAAIAHTEDYLEQLLAGARVGVIGYGHVGRLLCQKLAALGIAYCSYDPWLEASDEARSASLEEILACRVISLHPALTRKAPWPSYHLLGQEMLARIADTTLLINASRGPVIDNRALASQLRRGALPRVVLDVWEGEPQLSPDVLANVLIGTAHIAGYSTDSKLKATAMLLSAMAGQFDCELLVPPAETAIPDSIPVAGPISDAALLRLLLQARYRISDDDVRLREMVGLAAGSPERIAAGFDGLRKNYPIRRELAGSTVIADGLSAGQLDLLSALECTWQEGA